MYITLTLTLTILYWILQSVKLDNIDDTAQRNWWKFSLSLSKNST